jgi:D-alanyl-lipoteichoic acid acyltransferase DltB (MBOAT superfamily)
MWLGYAAMGLALVIGGAIALRLYPQNLITSVLYRISPTATWLPTSGLERILLIACIGAVPFWLMPVRWRKAWLAGFSLIMLHIYGATPAFIGWVVLLVFVIASAITASPKQIAATRVPRAGITLIFIWVGLGLLLGNAADLLPVLSLTPATLLLMVIALMTLLVCYRSDWLALMQQFQAIVFGADAVSRVQRLMMFVLTLGIVGGAGMFIGSLVQWVVNAPPASNTPFLWVLLALVLAFAAHDYLRASSLRQLRVLQVSLIGFILVAFVLLKSAGNLLSWVGFSYLAFRLLHGLIEALNQRDIPGNRFDFFIYSLFYPAQLVGPIDTSGHFVEELRSQRRYPDRELLLLGSLRIMMGGFKKFFVADLWLAPFALGTIPVTELSTGLAWLQLYSYAIFLYCDFSGFIDVVLGMSLLLNFHLPENFDRPYTRGSLAQFWQAWHITLSGWLRSYIFLPLSRTLLRSRLRPYPLVIVLGAQLVTMSLIGLWHGFTLNFLLWGLWHGGGLFIHKVFADRTRLRQLKWRGTWRANAFHIFSVLLTFHFVLFGWIFFALPHPADSLMFVARLVGVAP